MQKQFHEEKKMIRKQITQYLVNVIFEPNSFDGVGELLEILASLINGYSIPLRPENLEFFMNIILPLHKVETCQFYHSQLLKCVLNYLEKDSNLTPSIVSALLRFWPIANSQKQVMFISELQRVLEFCEVNQLKDLIRRLFYRLTKCLVSSNLSVIQQITVLFKTPVFLKILDVYKIDAFPFLILNVAKILPKSWIISQKQNLEFILTVIYQLDSQLYEETLQNPNKTFLTQSISLSQEQIQKHLDEKWKKFSQQAFLDTNPLEMQI